MNKLKTVITAAALTAATGASALELVTNGGFENGDSNGNYPSGWAYCQPRSWTGGSGLQKSGDVTWCSSIKAGSYAAFFQNDGSLSQTLDFPVAGKYRLTFSYTGRNGYLPHYRDVKIGGVQLCTYTANDYAESSAAWHDVTLDFDVTAAGCQTLSFNRTGGTGDKGSALDAVSCYLVTPAEAVTDCSSWRQVKAVIDAGGSVRLVKDVVSDGHEQLNNSQKVTVDLNGHRILASSRVFDLTKSAKLTLVDSVGGGAIDGQNIERTYAGGCVKVCGGCEFVLEAGTIQNFKMKDSHGGAVYNEGTATFNGGTITNCVATGTGLGGAVYNNAGTFNLKGGLITACSAKQGGAIANVATVAMTGGEIVGCTATDACGAIQQNGTMTITGGLIANNYAPWHGGIAQAGSSLTINGGTFTNNTSNSGNGGQCLAVNAGTLTVNGGVFLGPTSLYAANSTFNLYGGVFDTKPSDDFPTYGSAKRNMGTETQVGSKWVVGSPVATDTDRTALTGGSYTFCPTNELYAAAGLRVAEGSVVTGSGTSWKVAATNAVPCGDWATVRDNLWAGNSVTVTNDIAITAQNQGLYVVDAIARDVTLDLNGHTIDAYDGDGTAGEKDRLLTLASTVRSTITIVDSVGGGAFVGHKTVNGHSGAFAYVGYNCGIVVKGGAIRGFSTTGSGGAFYLANTAALELDGGAIESCTAAVSGGAVYVQSGTTVTVNGGSLCDNSSSGYGGAIYGQSSATVAVYGGYFRGNSTALANAGQFICIDNWEQKGYVYGGVFDGYDPQTYGTDDARAIKLQNAKAKVGDLYVIGANMTLNDDEAFLTGQFTFPITNETYTARGITVAEGSALADDGSLWGVTDGAEVECDTWDAVKTALLQGRNVKLTANITQTSEQPNLTVQNVTLDLNDHSIDRRSVSGQWWFMQVGAGATLTMADSSEGQTGKVLSDDSKSHGAKGNAFNVSGRLVINGGIYDGMYTANCGGCIYIGPNATLEMNGGTIKLCKSTFGGAIYNAGTFVMNGGVIENCTAIGTAAGSCGGGAVYNVGAFTMNGGELRGNNGYWGGGVGTIGASSIFTLNGGKIVSNTATLGYGAAVCQSTSGEFVMRGGEISGNTSANASYGGAVTIDTKFTMYGGTIGANLTRAIGLDSQGTVVIYGGVLVGNGANNIYKRGGTTTIYGAVSDNAVIGTYKASDVACTQVDTKYVVGKGVSANSEDELICGEYAFCPTNAEYAAASVKVDTVDSTLEATTNATWTLTPNSGAAPTWSQMTLTHVSTEGTCYDNQTGVYLLDNNASTKWCGAFAGDGKQWVEFTASGGVPERLELVTAGDTYIFVGRNWTGWTLYGWDGAAWTAIETQADQELNTTPGASRTYTLLNDKAYAKYRIVLNATAAGYGSGGQQMGDLKLYTDTSRSREPIAVSTWTMLKANLEAGLDVKLTADVTQSKSAGDVTAVPTGTTTLDLNGHTLYQVGLNRLFSGCGTKMTITDTSEAGTGSIVGDNSTGYMWGRVAEISSSELVIEKVTIKNFNGVWSNGSEVGKSGVFWLHGTNAKLTMNSGTIKDCQGSYGGAVYVETGSFTMNGGTISGCKSPLSGGAIYNSGTVTVNGGTIANCVVDYPNGYGYGGGAIYTSGALTINGGEFSGNKALTGACGGVLYVAGGQTATINDGLFTNNVCQLCGTVSYSQNGEGTVVINGGEFAYNNGKNDTFQNILKITGGSIHDNYNSREGRDILNMNSGSSISGGYIAGDDISCGSTKFITGGVFDRTPNATFLADGYECKASGDNYVVGKGVLADGATLTEGLYTFNPTNAEYAAAGVKVAETPVAQGTSPETWTIAAKKYCVCGDPACPGESAGEEHEIRTWHAWTSTTTLPTAAGNWYLAGDVDLSGQYSPVNGVTIDLAGHTIRQTATNARVINLNANVAFTLTDSVGGGKVTGGNIAGQEDVANNGGCVFMNVAGSQFVMYGGSICGNKALTGGGIYCNVASSVKVYGGAIEGNTAEKWGGGMCLSRGAHTLRNCIIRNNTAQEYWGGAVRIDYGTVTFVDCVMTNNTAANWPGISANVNGSPVVTLGGATVVRDNHLIGQTAQNNLGVESGYIYSVSATDPLTAGAQIGVTAAAGAAIVTSPNDGDYTALFFADNEAYAVVNDANQVRLVSTNAVVATIGETRYSSLQYAFNSAGPGETITLVRNTTENVVADSYTDATLDLNGFVLKASGGTALSLSENARLVLTNGDETVTHCFTVGSNGLWAWNDGNATGAIAYETLTARPAANAVIAVKGGCVTGSTGSGIWQGVGSEVVVNGGSVVGNGSTSYLGGGLYQTTGGKAYLTLNGGRFCGNYSNQHGGGLYAHGGGDFVINGGDVTFNHAAGGQGGGTCHGQVFLNGGRISWNKTAYDGGGVRNTGSMTMTGGEIVGNEAANNGGGVYNESAFTMTGGTISNCTATSYGGAVYVTGAFTLNGGVISGCETTKYDANVAYGGAVTVASGGTFTMNAGELINNRSGAESPNFGWGSAVNVASGGTSKIYGGVITNNTSFGNGPIRADGTSLVYGGVIKDNRWYWDTGTYKVGTVCGGVFDRSDVQTVQAGCAIELVGDSYVVGANIAQEEGKLTGGTYTFNPANAEYAAANVAVAPWVDVTTDEAGDPQTWTLTDGTSPVDAGETAKARIKADGTCWITGSGETAETEALAAQWASVRDVRIASGVTGVGDYTFYKFSNLTNVTVSADCKKLGDGAFFRCLSLEQITFEGEIPEDRGENALVIHAGIRMEGDTPVVYAVPNVTVNGKDMTLKGSNDLETWVSVAEGDEKNYHFFKFVAGE